VIDLTVHLMYFYCKIPLNVQFLKVKKNKLYNLQRKKPINPQIPACHFPANKEILSVAKILLLKAISKKSTNYAKLSGLKPDKRNDRLLCALKQCDQVI